MTDDSSPTTGWFVALGDKREGPMAEERVRAYISAGRIDARTLVWQQGFAEWVPISTQAPFSKDVGPPAPPPLPLSDKAHNAFVASAVIWAIQLAMGLYWTMAVANEIGAMGLGGDAAAGFQAAMLAFGGISAIVFVAYLMKNNTARILAIAGSVLSILRAFAEMKKTGGEDAVFFVVGILLNIAFIWLAIQAKPACQRKSGNP